MFCWYQISDSRPSDPIPVHGPVGFILNETPLFKKKTFIEKKNETNLHSPYTFAIPIRASQTAYRGHSRTHSPPSDLCLACYPVDSLTKWYISTWNSSDSNALCFFFYTKKKKKRCVQLFVVSCLLFLWLFCHGLLKHLPRLRAQMRWWRDVVYVPGEEKQKRLKLSWNRRQLNNQQRFRP